MVSTPFLHLFSFFGVLLLVRVRGPNLGPLVGCCCLLRTCLRSSQVVLLLLLLGILFFQCRCSPCSLLPIPLLVVLGTPPVFCSPGGSSMCRLLVVLVFLLVQASMVLGCLGTVLLVLLLRILLVVVWSFACFLRVKCLGFGWLHPCWLPPSCLPPLYPAAAFLVAFFRFFR